MPSIAQVRREEEVEHATRVSRCELEDLGMAPEPSNPHIINGWLVHRRPTDSALRGYYAIGAGRGRAIVTGRKD